MYIGKEEARNRKIKNNNRSLGGINVSIYIYILVALLIFCYLIFLFWKIPRISEKEIEYTMFRIQKDFLDDLNFGLKQACENFIELGFFLSLLFWKDLTMKSFRLFIMATMEGFLGFLF